MRFGRVLALCLLLITVSAPVVYAQDSDTVPAEVQGHPEQAAADHIPGPVHEEGGGSMPQLDPTFYASQLFWLVIAGVLMYVAMSKIALPRVAKVLGERDDQVRKDLERAARLKQEAEDIKVIYGRALRDADERAKALHERTVRELQEKHKEAMESLNAKANEALAKTEKTLMEQKKSVLNEVDAISKKLSDTIIKELGKKAA